MARKATRPDARLIQEFVLTQQKLPTDRPVVQFIRQSTKRQKKENKVSAEMQDADMHNNLLALGWIERLILPPIDDDSGKSGTKRRDERAGLDRLYRLIENDLVGTVAAYNVSRIYRVLSKAETGKFCDLVLQHKVPIVTRRRIYWPTQEDNKALMNDFQAAADYIEDHTKGVIIAAKNYHIEMDASYAGNAIPFGFVVDGMGEKRDRKFYRIYEPHATLIRWLFRRFRELGGNLPLLGRELKRINFRFPPFEKGISPHVGLRHVDADGYYPLRSRAALISILTNKAYIGWYEYGGMLVSKTAHDPIVDIDDFLYAYERLSGLSLDSTEEQERKPRERRYGGATALLDGIVRSNGLPVYVIREKYVAKIDNDGFTQADLTVPVQKIDAAFSKAMIAILASLEVARRHGLHADLTARVEALRQEQKRQVETYADDLARIDKEIQAEEMAQRVSKEEGDEQGYRTATKQLVQLRKDKAAIEARAREADREAQELEKCHNLIDCACQQWEAMDISTRKWLVRLLVTSANIIDASPHFLRLDVTLGKPINHSFSVYLYRLRGSRLFWNEQDEETLRRYYPDREATMQALPTRTWDSIRQRAQDMGLGRGKGEHGMEPALSYDDIRLMEETGARIDRPVWTMHDQQITKHLWAPVRGLIQAL